MKIRKRDMLSLEQLKEKELSLQADELGSDFSDLSAEQELDFNLEYEREYTPEVWEVENESDSAGTQDDEEPV